MSAVPAGLLIWVKGLRGPEAQKCTELPRNNATSREYPVLAKHGLTHLEFQLCLDDLKKMYPHA